MYGKIQKKLHVTQKKNKKTLKIENDKLEENK